MGMGLGTNTGTSRHSTDPRFVFFVGHFSPALPLCVVYCMPGHANSAPATAARPKKPEKMETNATLQSADGCACPRGNRRPAGATSVECLHFQIAH